MKFVLRSSVSICLVLLSGCGYAFDPKTFTFIETSTGSTTTDTQGTQRSSPPSQSLVGFNQDRSDDNDRSSPGSDNSAKDEAPTNVNNSPSQPSSGGNDDDASSGATPSPTPDDDASSGASPSPTPDDNDDSSGGATSPSLPNDDDSDAPSIPGDTGGGTLGGSIDPIGKPIPGDTGGGILGGSINPIGENPNTNINVIDGFLP